MRRRGIDHCFGHFSVVPTGLGRWLPSDPSDKSLDYHRTALTGLELMAETMIKAGEGGYKIKVAETRSLEEIWFLGKCKADFLFRHYLKRRMRGNYA